MVMNLENRDGVMVLPLRAEHNDVQVIEVETCTKDEGARIKLEGEWKKEEGFVLRAKKMTPNEIREKLGFRTEKKRYEVSDEFYSIEGWMTSILKLSGNELLIYALVWSYNRIGRALAAADAYIAAKVGCDVRSVQRNLKSLIGKGLLVKIKVHVKGDGENWFYTAYFCKKAMDDIIWDIDHDGNHVHLACVGVVEER